MEECLSLHGGAGYTMGDYWDGDDIVCCLCKEHIKNPPPVGHIPVFYTLKEKPLRFLWGMLAGDMPVKKEIPEWPMWIRGRRGLKASEWMEHGT